ncbi:MAG TPA: LPS assembly lipoprotein LptE [Burkholderiaceae bacterium]
MWWCSFRGAAAACLLAAALSACGFHLRGPHQIPFETMVLNFPANSPLGTELARNIRAGSETRIVKDASQADAVLDLLSEARDRQVLTLNSQGRAVEYQLHYRLRFRLRDRAGLELIEPTELHAQRDISFNDTQVLSKESEETLLYRDMQTDLVQQLLRRIEAVRPHAAAG